ncbi:MAG: aldo/keto reductase [Anaerolineae bacterium]
MKYRNLGRTGLKVSALCLGTMQWGWTADENAAFQVMDAFVEAGGNFLDTADVYSFWAENNPGGVSEQIIGRWMTERGNRRQIVLATKVRGRMWDGPNGEGLSRKHIVEAVEDSLRRLQTDYIDLYQSHAFDDTTPIEETMAAFDRLVQQGKVLYVGCSNYPAWRLAKALWASDVKGLVRYESLQPHYNLAHRAEFERELMSLCQDEGLGVIPYSPLAAGFLTGKYRRDQPVPDSDRAAGIRNRYFNERGWAIIDKLDKVAGNHGVPLSQVALAWLLANPVVTSPIIGANTVQQLSETLPAVELQLSNEETQALDAASAWLGIKRSQRD